MSNAACPDEIYFESRILAKVECLAEIYFESHILT